ncbi:hypothetical protein [Rhodococcus sp. (in: high G+C Gram-positive bacteria)]|uniref:hypothetical protein n=2 Tax=Rhodococcus sp. TaxID=1831 RepID=UPI003315C824
MSLMQSSATFPMRQFLGDGELFRDRLAVVIAARSFRVHPYARNITVGTQQFPTTSLDVSWLRLKTTTTRARRAHPDCAIVEVV